MCFSSSYMLEDSPSVQMKVPLECGITRKHLIDLSLNKIQFRLQQLLVVKYRNSVSSSCNLFHQCLPKLFHKSLFKPVSMIVPSFSSNWQHIIYCVSCVCGVDMASLYSTVSRADNHNSRDNREQFITMLYMALKTKQLITF